MSHWIKQKATPSSLVQKLVLKRRAIFTDLHQGEGFSFNGSYVNHTLLASQRDVLAIEEPLSQNRLSDGLRGETTSTESMHWGQSQPNVMVDGIIALAPWSSNRHCLPRTEKHYKQIMCFDLLLQCSLNGVMAIPYPNRILVNSSSKEITQDKKELVVGLSAVLMISGQRPQTTWAKRSISGFKLRAGDPLGCKVTLRERAMYKFLDRMVSITLPRARPSLINHTVTNLAAYDIGIGDPLQFYELEHHFDLFRSLHGVDIALLKAPAKPSHHSGRWTGELLWSGLQLVV